MLRTSKRVTKRPPWRVFGLAALISAWAFVYASMPRLSTWFTYRVLDLSPGTRLASSVEFFAYDAPKVLMLLLLVVFGMGCPKCKLLAERTEQAARELGVQYQLEKVTDFERIVAYRIMATPALAIDGVLQFVGRVPTVGALKELLAAKAASHA
jgi:small redox-active disulfide protein 2